MIEDIGYTQSVGPVTILIDKSVYEKRRNPFNIGGIIFIKNKKRVRLQITDIAPEPYNHTIGFVPVYFPAPKSRLNNKSKFSKFKMKILLD